LNIKRLSKNELNLEKETPIKKNLVIVVKIIILIYQILIINKFLNLIKKIIINFYYYIIKIMTYDNDLYELNNKINNKFIREHPKPYAMSYNKTFLIPNYSEINNPKSNNLMNLSDNRKFSLNTNLVAEKVIIPDDTTVKYNNSKEKVNIFTENFENVLNCRNIHSHILSCPVCMKVYKQNNNAFIIIIIILFLLVLIVLKIFLRKN